MNIDNPPYDLVTEVGKIVSLVKTTLNLTNLNYLYGYLNEIKETLAQDSKSVAFRSKKYPLVWLVEPFTIVKGEEGIYGSTNLNILIINGSDKNWKAAQRRENNFNPIIHPIYSEFLKQIKIASDVFTTDNTPKHSLTDRYYWGEENKIIDDVFDCSEISQLQLKINNKQNCIISNSF